MRADHLTPHPLHHEPLCYFSIVPAAHFSVETPTIIPASEYQPYTPSDPANPLLALRPAPPLNMTSPLDASRLLQLQTQAAYAQHPVPQPLQPQRASSTSSSSSTSSTGSSSTPCCCRCRRESFSSMYQIGTNRYYCSHCARMTGYSAG